MGARAEATEAFEVAGHSPEARAMLQALFVGTYVEVGSDMNCWSLRGGDDDDYDDGDDDDDDDDDNDGDDDDDEDDDDDDADDDDVDVNEDDNDSRDYDSNHNDNYVWCRCRRYCRCSVCI